MTDLEQRRIVVLRSEGKSTTDRHRNDSVLYSCHTIILSCFRLLAVCI